VAGFCQHGNEPSGLRFTTSTAVLLKNRVFRDGVVSLGKWFFFGRSVHEDEGITVFRNVEKS
jgi:hypothetical protein